MIESSVLKDHPQVQYLEDLKIALEKVDPAYFNWYMHKLADDGSVSEDIRNRHEERTFAYELYHQVRKIMESKEASKRYQSVYLNGEAIKDDKFFTNLYEGLSYVYKDINDLKSNKRMPDLVLHKDQGSIKPEGQIYLAEIKMGDNDKALDDLRKLSMFKSSKLNFSFYIFIYVRKTMFELKEELKNINTSKFSKDIVCLCTKIQKAECYTLGELI